MDINYFSKYMYVFLLVGTSCFVRHINSIIVIPGDVTIVGLFSVREQSDNGCSTRADINSVMAVEAVQWYIKNLNEKAGLDLKIGFEAYDTCRSKLKAGNIAIQIINRALLGEMIIGVLGPYYSSEAESVSLILSNVNLDYQMALVGFSSTATRLSDVTKYPNYVRVIPNDDIQVETMVQSMIKLEWNRIAVLYEEDTYGIEATERLEQVAQTADICISTKHSLSVVDGINVDAVRDILWDVVIGDGPRPAANGIVLIVTAPTAKLLFQLMNSLDITSFPTIMLSEGFGMDVSVFSNFGVVLDEAKGSYAVSPPYIGVEEFTEHWKSIFRDKDKFDEQVKTNPWLQDVYERISECEQANCAFTPRTEQQLSTDFADKSLFIQYAMLGAHALIKATDTVQQSLCQGSGNCSSFYDHFRPREVLTSLKNLNLKMASDFAWSVPSLQSVVATIDASGEIVFPDNTPIYELNNFRANDNDGTDFELNKIGNFVRGEMDIDFERIRDYDRNGNPIIWPGVRKAQCVDTKTCSECFPLKQLQETVFYENGDIFIVGIVPVFEKVGIKECGETRENGGYQMVEAMRQAVKIVNSGIGEYSTYYPGLKVGLVILNSCNNPAVIQRKIFDLHHNGITLYNGTKVDLNNKILGYIAEFTSTVSISVAKVLSMLKYVQIGYGCTSPALSNRQTFPYFMRVVTPDDAQAMLMVEMMLKLNVTYAQIVYSAGPYGEDGYIKVTEIARTKGICIIQGIRLNEGDNVYGIYESLRKHAHAKVVLFFLQMEAVVRLTQAMLEKMQKGEFVFIGSETWARLPEILKADVDKKLLGSFTISLEMYQDKSLRTHMQKLTPRPYSDNPWVTMYLQKKTDCYFDLSFDKSQTRPCENSGETSDLVLDTFDTIVYVATMTLLKGAGAFLKRTCGIDDRSVCKEFIDHPEELVKELLKIRMDLDDSGDMIKVFNNNGDGNIGYRIYNIQKDEIDPQKLTYAQVGRYPLAGTFTFELDQIVQPSTGKLVSQCPNELACKECFQHEPVTPPGSKDEKDSDIGLIVLGTLLGLVIIVVIILSTILARIIRRKDTAANDIYITPTGDGFRRDNDYVKDEQVVEHDVSSFQQDFRYT